MKRLVEDPRWKGLLQPLTEEKLSESRLAANGERLAARIAAGGAAATATAAVKVGLGIKLGVPALAVAALVTAGVLHRAPEGPAGAGGSAPAEVSAPSTAAADEEGADVDADEAAPEAGPAAHPTDPRVTPRPRTHAPRSGRSEGPGRKKGRTHAPTRSPEVVEPVGAAAGSPEPANRESAAPAASASAPAPAAPTPAPAPAPAQAQEPPPAPPPPAPAAPEPERQPSALEVQLGLYHAAEAAARARHYDRALELLDQIEHRFPNGPLTPEVMLSRADVLSRAGRTREAIAFVELAVQGSAPKKGALYRLLGDLRLSEGDCPRAVEAFRRALAHELDAAEAERAKQGLAACKR
jgi:hypothetical protein